MHFARKRLPFRARLATEAEIGLLTLYHPVPAPRNAMAIAAFKGGLPDGVLITEDGMVISLPASSKEITFE